MVNPLSNPYYLLSPLVATIISLALITLVLLKSRRTFTSWIFSCLLLSITLLSLTLFGMRSSPDVHRALLWDRAMPVIGLSIFVFYYHFALTYTKNRGQRGFLYSAYLLLVVATVIAPTDLFVKEIRLEDYGYAPTIGPLIPPLFIIYNLLVGGAIHAFVQGYRASFTREEKNRLVYIIIAGLFPITAGYLDAFFNLPPATIWCNLVFGMLCTLAIVKYHLLDIRIVIRKSLVYSLISILVAVPYVTILVLVNYIFKPTLEPWWMHAIIILLLASFLRPLYSWAQQLIDRIFYRERYDYFRALEWLNQETRSIMNIKKLGSTMVELVCKTLRISSACLFMMSEGDKGLVLVSSTGVDKPPSAMVLKHQNLLVNWLKLHRDILSHEDLNIIPQLQGLPPTEMNKLEKIGAKLYVPIKTGRGELSGMLVLGEKLSQQDYSNEDRNLFRILSSQMAITLENTSLYNDAVQARENLETWLNSINDCILIINTDYTIQFMNRISIEKWGSNIDKKCWSSLGIETVCSSCPLQKYQYGNRDGYQYSQIIRDREYDVASAPLLNPDGSLSVIEVLRDVTERRKMEGELQKAERLESIGTLAGGIAHDFNNILTGILGNITLAKKNTESGGKTFKRLLEAEKASLRAVSLTQQLLTLSKGGAPVTKTASLVHLIEDSATFALRGSNVKCELSIPDDLWLSEVDEGQLSQVISNIVINANEAMPKGGTINIRARNTTIGAIDILPLPAGNYIKISIEDHGIGIAKKHIGKIFDPFFTTKQKGSGLGLTTTYAIIRNHGGHITVDSKLKVGTTFNIYLPATKKIISIEKEIREETPMAGKGKLLIMDDEEVIRQLLYDELTDIGYKVELAKDGSEAIDIYKKAKEAGQSFNAVILDLTIPGGMGGKETIEKLLEIDLGIKAIVTSGYSTDALMADFLKYGFSGILIKPYKISDVEDVLHKVITGISK